MEQHEPTACPECIGDRVNWSTNDEFGQWVVCGRCKGYGGFDADGKPCVLPDHGRELLELLHEYGRHGPGCSAEYGIHYRCRCGWRKVLENLPATVG
jgi:hypothetical protein